MEPTQAVLTGQLVSALRSRGFEVVNQTNSPKQLRFLGRVSQQAVNGWLIVVHRLLSAGENTDWSVDISKQYFLRAGKVMFGWRLIFQGPELEQKLPLLLQLISTTARAKAVVMEQPLVGANASRNSMQRGKGAAGVLKAVVGPMAVAGMRNS